VRGGEKDVKRDENQEKKAKKQGHDLNDQKRGHGSKNKKKETLRHWVRGA